jgi:hypothetical protein
VMLMRPCALPIIGLLGLQPVCSEPPVGPQWLPLATLCCAARPLQQYHQYREAKSWAAVHTKQLGHKGVAVSCRALQALSRRLLNL